MRAIVQDTLGGPEVLRLAEVPIPEPGPTEVLVKVHAAGVNPVDWKVRRSGGFLGSPPFTVGWDVSGVVTAIGRGVTRFTVGDEVFGMPRFPHEAAAYAEYVTAPARHFALKPVTLSHVEAGALPLAGLTVWQVLHDTALLEPDQRVLVPAAAGGVGHVAVQVAKALGAYVIATASPAKHDFVRSLGADEILDYTTVDVPSAVRDMDVVLGLVGSQAKDLLTCLRPGGLIVTLTSDTDPDIAAAGASLGVRVVDFLAEPDHAGLAHLSTLVTQGALKVHVSRTFPLAEASLAHAELESGHTMGKIVLLP